MTNRIRQNRWWGVVVVLCAATRSLAADDLILKAMRDELDRSMRQLHLAPLAKPYFIAYRVDEINNTETTASFGSLLGSRIGRLRLLSVEVRVGDYSLDNTNVIAWPYDAGRGLPGTRYLPVDDNYQEVRRQLWLITDSAYKRALEDFSKKKALLESQKRSEDLPDFSREEPATIPDQRPPATLDVREAERRAREVSALFRQMPHVFASSVRLAAVNTYTRYLNSEGTSFRRMDPGVMLTVTASTQAADGMPLEDFVTETGRSLEDLPKPDLLAARVREMGARLEQLRSAPLLERYDGPVLIEGQAAAELFSQVFAPHLLAVRRPLSDNPQLGVLLARAEQNFAGRIGARVLPDFLSVVDDPTLDEFNQVRLVGGFKVDDEGVRTRRTVLVEKGILKTLLATRNPVPGIARSTGNQGGTGPIPTNLFLTAESGPGAAEMKAELLKLVKQRGLEYGVLVTRISNPILLPSTSQMTSLFSPQGMFGGRGLRVIAAYKVFPDGRQEPIRNADLVEIGPATFKDIALASRDQTAYSAPFSAPAALMKALSGGGGAPGGIHILSFVVPSLLFEDLPLQKSTSEVPTPPIAKHPFFDR